MSRGAFGFCFTSLSLGDTNLILLEDRSACRTLTVCSVTLTAPLLLAFSQGVAVVLVIAWGGCESPVSCSIITISASSSVCSAFGHPKAAKFHGQPVTFAHFFCQLGR
eukprot:g47894.t1